MVRLRTMVFLVTHSIIAAFISKHIGMESYQYFITYLMGAFAGCVSSAILEIGD